MRLARLGIWAGVVVLAGTVATPARAQCDPEEVAKLIASDAATQDSFGCSVALSGDTAVIGAWSDDHAGGENAGSAYVFDLNCGAPPPSIIAWRSVRLHPIGGGQGLYLPIELDPAATGNGVTGPTVETRSGGVQRIEVDFDRAIELTMGATFEAVDAGSGAIYPATGVSLVNDDKTLVIEFEPGLPDQACYRIDLAGNVVGLVGDTDCLVRVLAGDTNGDGSTNNIDQAQVRSKNGTLAADGPRFDVNLDGSVNNIDQALVRSLNGCSATCP